LRDEAHRFGITFHRDLRSKGQVKSELDTIKGIGPKTASTLLRHFKSVKRVREASLQEVAAVVGMAKAQIVKNGLSK
jgi:excinuclease ABC subunit C